MKVTGVILNEQKQVSHYIVHYPGGTFIKESNQVENPEVSSETPHYQVDGWERLERLLHQFRDGSPLSKALAGIDEHPPTLMMQNEEIYIEKSYRSDEFFSEYEYEEDGYDEARFHGWDSIPDIVSKEIGVPRNHISTGDGEKLWFGVHVYCNDFAKLKKIS